MASCAAEFAAFVMSEVAALCAARGRATMRGADVVDALRVLGFADPFVHTVALFEEDEPKGEIRGRKRRTPQPTATTTADEPPPPKEEKETD
jgi:hypothetical protein